MKLWLKISRPGLWFPTIWIYLLPLGQHYELIHQTSFWVGLLFVTFPLNFFVYSLNDLGDVEADKFNKRKGNFLFGAKASKEQLQKAVMWAIVIFLSFAWIFKFFDNWRVLLLFIAIGLINYIYNFKPFKVKSRPPFELLIQIAYILTAVFSSWLNDVALISWQALVYLCFFCFQAHLAGEIMDIDPDIQAGKTTSATRLGRLGSKIFMCILLAVEVYILMFWFNDWILAICLGLFLIWLLMDMFIFFKNKSYSLFQMYLFGYGMNALGFASMIWISYSGKLLHPIWP